jgi:uncharacterized protein YdeI (YjbR/CyaY-like superfamily)
VETAPDGKDLVHPSSPGELRAWLAANGLRTRGLWVARFKRATGKEQVTYDELVEELLCFGWIDSTTKSLGEERTLHWVSPRRARSNWSPSNLTRFERLEREGRMTDAGRQAFTA